MIEHNAAKRDLPDIGNNLRFDASAAFLHADDDRLDLASAFRLGAPAAVKRLVNFDVTAKHLETVDLAHKIANLMADAPSGLIGDAERSLHFLSAHAVARRDKEIDRVKPGLQ